VVKAERLEFATYHRLWSWHFSNGMLQEFYRRSRG
jgi:hypothetical protein